MIRRLLQVVAFSAFWDNFRAAILNQDTIKIIATTHFPFQTRGELDSDPVIEYSKDEFPFVLQTYLQQQEYTALNEQSEFELIKATTDVRKEQQTGDWVRIGDMEFKEWGKNGN